MKPRAERFPQDMLDLWEDPALYDAARDVCHSFGVPWTDPRSGVTYKPPTGAELDELRKRIRGDQ